MSDKRLHAFIVRPYGLRNLEEERIDFIVAKTREEARRELFSDGKDPVSVQYAGSLSATSIADLLDVTLDPITTACALKFAVAEYGEKFTSEEKRAILRASKKIANEFFV